MSERPGVILGWPVLTSDPDDLRAPDPGVVVEEI